MSDSLTEAYKSSPEAERQRQRIAKMAARRDELMAAIAQKYPEVAELLSVYYRERNWP